MSQDAPNPPPAADCQARVARAAEDVAQPDRAEAVERLKRLRRTIPALRLAELLALRHEGHRYG
jgi:hypothetical protein